MKKTTIALALVIGISAAPCRAGTQQQKTQASRPRSALVHTPAGSRAPLQKRVASALTLDHLKNGSYLIPDLACGYTPVDLKDGHGEHDGVEVVFGRAVFGNLAGEKQPTAIVHLAYCTPELGWLQQLVFVKENNGKLVQIAEYSLDDRDQLQGISIEKGQVVVETTGHGMADSKLTCIKVAQSKQGCLLEVSEWGEDGPAQASAPAELAPYLSKVEERVGNTWSPLSKDRGEHVVVAFKIQPSGEVADVHVSTSSEVASADQAAVEAVAQAGPFPPFCDKEPIAVGLEFQAGVNLEPQPYGHVYR